MTRKILSLETRMATAAALAAVLQNGFAADRLTLDVGASVIGHSNAALQDDDEESDTERVAEAAIGYDHADDGLLLVNLDYAVRYRDFHKDVQDDQTEVDGRADLLLHLLQRRLDFVLAHQVTQSLTDRRELDVTDNRERRSVITAGFDGYAHLSTVDALVLRPRYTDVSFQDSTGSDSKRSNVTAAWQRALSQVSMAELSATYGKVEFDESVNDYDSMGMQLSYKTALTRLNYELAGGFTKLERDQGDDVDGFLVRVAVDYKGDGYNWGGTLIHELTDTSLGLSGEELNLSNFNAADSNFNLQDILERTQFDLYGLRQLDAANKITVGAGYREDDYETLLRDEQGYYALFGYEYSLNTFWTVGFDVRYEQTRFVDDPADLEYKDLTPQIFAVYRHSQRLEVRFAVSSRDRDANDPTAEYTDNQAMVGVKYRLY